MRRILAAALLVTGLLAGCETKTTQTMSVPPDVPAPLAETLPKPPVTAEPLLWQPGHWDWKDSGYVWQPGEYVPAAGHGPLFQPGYWSHGDAGWQWQAAHWTS